MSDASMFFLDGVRQIDYVLVCTTTVDEHKVEKRLVFENDLQKTGVELEVDEQKIVGDRDRKYRFVKLHAPRTLLLHMAEFTRVKMPIKECDIETPETVFTRLRPHWLTDNMDLFPRQRQFFTAAFSQARPEMFTTINTSTCFSDEMRSEMVHELLVRASYEEGSLENIGNGIDRLLHQNVYTAAFPLHDGPFKTNEATLKMCKRGMVEIIHLVMKMRVKDGCSLTRQLLYATWARPGIWYCYQPLDAIRRYLGVQIAIYFAWLGFYTSMLIPAAVVGVLVFIYGLATFMSDTPTNEMCDESRAGNLIMCPECDGSCSYWRLRDSCSIARLASVFDNWATVFFACFMSVWACVFLEFWKRKHAELQHDWNMSSFSQHERSRPDFLANTEDFQMDPVTKLTEPFLPYKEKLQRKLKSFFIISFMMSLALASVAAVVAYRVAIVGKLDDSENATLRRNAKLITILSASLLQLVVILILNKIYGIVVVVLVHMELPRTDTEFGDNITAKICVFQFVNFYAAMFYVAFVKSRRDAWPGSYGTVAGNRVDQCDPCGCLIELCIQLGIVMLGNQVLNNFREMCLATWIQKGRAATTPLVSTSHPWEMDNELEDMPSLALFYEYLEMVVQYSFVTIFVAAFPLAPLFALVNNLMEIRINASKFITRWKRPVAHRAENIGIWYDILKAISFIAVLTNALIIGWTSDFVPKIAYQLNWSSDKSLAGYVNHSLSVYDVQDFESGNMPQNNKSGVFGVVQQCRYAGYRYPPNHESRYKYTATHWNVLVCRTLFVIAFEHFVFLLSWFICVLIPEVSDEVRTKVERERYLTNKARFQVDFGNASGDVYAQGARRRSTRLLEIPMASTSTLQRASLAQDVRASIVAAHSSNILELNDEASIHDLTTSMKLND